MFCSLMRSPEGPASGQDGKRIVVPLTLIRRAGGIFVL